MAVSLFLTERDESYYEGLFQADGRTPVKPPRFKGRIVTTLHKAKEIRSFVERCITIAKGALPHQEAAEEFDTDEERNSEGWRKWREGEMWQKWNAAIAPAITARRRVYAMLRDKEAVQILFDEIAPRYVDRPGGYTRVMKLAQPRLGDAGAQAILELVGKNDRVKQASQKPAFDSDSDNDDAETTNEPVEETVAASVADSTDEATAEKD